MDNVREFTYLDYPILTAQPSPGVDLCATVGHHQRFVSVTDRKRGVKVCARAGAWEFPPQFSFYSVRNNGNGGLLVSTIERPEHAHIKEMAVEAVRAMGEQ